MPLAMQEWREAPQCIVPGVFALSSLQAGTVVTKGDEHVHLEVAGTDFYCGPGAPKP